MTGRKWLSYATPKLEGDTQQVCARGNVDFTGVIIFLYMVVCYVWRVTEKEYAFVSKVIVRSCLFRYARVGVLD